MSTNINTSTPVDVSHISKSQELSNMLEQVKRERDSIKAQMYDATRKLDELSGIIAALQRSIDLMSSVKEE